MRNQILIPIPAFWIGISFFFIFADATGGTLRSGAKQNLPERSTFAMRSSPIGVHLISLIHSGSYSSHSSIRPIHD
jgi:hypothetical protein